MKIGIILAMDIEYRKMLHALGGTPESKYAGNDIILTQSGMGKVNAAINTTQLIVDKHPDCILSTGLAGGLGKDVHQRDIVIAKQTVYHDVWFSTPNAWGQVQGLPARYDADERLLNAAIHQCQAKGLQPHEGLICTGDLFVTTQVEADAIRNHFPEALACDMESAAIAQTCHRFHTPFLSMRLVSDTPGNTANHSQQWEDFLDSMAEQTFQWVIYLLEALGQQQ